jgi:hypothetical protein
MRCCTPWSEARKHAYAALGIDVPLADEVIEFAACCIYSRSLLENAKRGLLVHSLYWNSVVH